MPTLPLAIEIAETVSEAMEKQSPIDVEAKADELLEGHPKSDATRFEIAETLRDESKAAGVQKRRRRPICRSTIGMQADRNGHQWSREDVETLGRLVNDGMAVVDIATALQRTKLGVKSKAMLIGLKLSHRQRPIGDLRWLAGGSRPKV